MLDVLVMCGEELGVYFYLLVILGLVNIFLVEWELSWNFILFIEIVKELVIFYEFVFCNLEFRREQEEMLNLVYIVRN